MKSRFKILAMSTLLVLTMATGAYAQAVFQLSSGTEARGRSNGHAEASGNITLFLTRGSITAETGDAEPGGTVTIDYGVPITNTVGRATTTTAADDEIAIRVCGEDLLLAGDEVVGEDGANRATISSDMETLTIEVEMCTGDDDTVISVSGVRLSLVGSGADDVTASVTGTGLISILGNEEVVIRSVVDPLSDDTVNVTKLLELVRHTGAPPSDEKAPEKKFRLVIEEPHNDSFDGAKLRLEFAGIPEDVELTLDAWLTTRSNYKKTTPSPALDAPQNEIGLRSTVRSNTGVVIVTPMGTMQGDDPDTGDTEPDVSAATLTNGRDVIIVQGVISLGTAAEKAALLPLSLEIQVTVDMGELGDIDDTDDIPRFASDKTTAMTVIESTSDQTTLTAPYVVYDGAFDTGIAVSNMTSGKSAQSGQVEFKLYMDGNEISYSAPTMMPQTTMSMLLSEILREAGHTGMFSGYMTITTDFTPAGGSVYISDFSGFSSVVVLKEN